MGNAAPGRCFSRAMISAARGTLQASYLRMPSRFHKQVRKMKKKA
jgi:hypothetical protein